MLWTPLSAWACVRPACRWAPPGSDPASLPRVTLVGKGVCFDTGGLDIKPAAAMKLMKARQCVGWVMLSVVVCG